MAISVVNWLGALCVVVLGCIVSKFVSSSCSILSRWLIGLRCLVGGLLFVFLMILCRG